MLCVLPKLSKNWIRLSILIFYLPVVNADNVLNMSLSSTLKSSGFSSFMTTAFQNETGIVINAIDVGSGQALRLGRVKSVEVVFINEPEQEKRLVEEGYALSRTEVMYNDFVIVGPKSDPAKVHRAKTAAQAFQYMFDHEVDFVSRGDFSAVHMLELKLWRLTERAMPLGKSWYFELGAGMKKTFDYVIYNKAYTLIDRGTWLFYNPSVKLKMLYENADELRNVYSVLVVSGLSEEKSKKAMLFQNWITSKAGQGVIRAHRIKGQQLYSTLIY